MDDAAVLAECAARPDDDAPRLVWADLVGGERGELVVLQCDLARGDLSPEEAAVRRARERELLAHHGNTWAGPLARVATSWTYRRGFVEAARLDAFDAEALAAHPLLATVALANPALLPPIAALRALRGLALPGGALDVLGSSPVVRTLRMFGIDRLAPPAWRDARAVLGRMRVEELWLTRHELVGEEIEHVLDAAPHATTLVLDDTRSSTPLSLERPVRALRVRRVDLELLVTHAADSLERLHLEAAPRDVTYLPALRALRILEVDGDGDEVVQALAHAAPLPHLRSVRVEKIAPHAAAAFRARYGAGVELRERRWREPLPHHDRDAFLMLGPICVAEREAVLVRPASRPAIWKLPMTPQHIDVGRTSSCFVHLPDSMVARRHCRLTWSGDRHVVEDLGSTNGTFVDGERVQRAALEDGAELLVGPLVFHYFVGPDAHERASLAIADASVEDPVTRLPIDDRPPHRVTTRRNLSPRVVRAVVAELQRLAEDEPITYVRDGVFGVLPATAARVGTRTLAVTVDEYPIDVDLVAS